MGLFHRTRQQAPGSGRPGPQPQLTGLPGWAPAGDDPFDGEFAVFLAPIIHAMYDRRGDNYIAFRDAYRCSVDGRTVIVANAWAEWQTNNYESSHRGSRHWHRAAVVAAELPTMSAPILIYPARFAAPAKLPLRSTADAAFDARFGVRAGGGIAGLPDPITLLSPEVRVLIAARDNWSWVGERSLFGCVLLDLFETAAAIDAAVDEVLRAVAALPAAVVPARVDHSTDDLAARLVALTSLDQAMAFLQGLTSAERETLANSNTPLAAFADVRTPQQAMARIQTLDPATKMQLMAQFMKLNDQDR